MLRIFEAIKKSPFLNGNYPFRTPSKNASAEIRLTHNLFQNVMPQPSVTSADWHLYTKNFPLETPILKPCRFSVE